MDFAVEHCSQPSYAVQRQPYEGAVGQAHILFEVAEQAHVTLLNSASGKGLLISLFEQITLGQCWQPGLQLQSYPLSSVYFGLYTDSDLIGGLQLVIGNDCEGLPCLTVWPELDLFGKTDVADIALLAIDKQYRGQKRLFWLLCIEMWRYCRRTGITTLWAEVTPANLRLYRRLGWPLQIAGPLRSHWGEECYPCSMTTEEVGQAIAQKAVTIPSYRALLAQAHRREEQQPLTIQSLRKVPEGAES